MAAIIILTVLESRTRHLRSLSLHDLEAINSPNKDHWLVHGSIFGSHNSLHQ